MELSLLFNIRNAARLAKSSYRLARGRGLGRLQAAQFVVYTEITAWKCILRIR